MCAIDHRRSVHLETSTNESNNKREILLNQRTSQIIKVKSISRSLNLSMASYQKSLVVVALAAMLAACLAAPVSQDAELAKAVASVWGSETVAYETTEKNLESIRQILIGDDMKNAMLIDPANKDLYYKVVYYLAICQNKDEPSADPEIAQSIIDEMIQDERANKNSANLISYLYECKLRLRTNQ